MSMKLIFAIVNKDDSGSVSSALTRAGDVYKRQTLACLMYSFAIKYWQSSMTAAFLELAFKAFSIAI